LAKKKLPAPHVAANIKAAHTRALVVADNGADQHGRELVHAPRSPPTQSAQSPAISIGHNGGPPLPTLTALELEQHVTVERAAEIFAIHVETFETTYAHLIRRVSPRCRRVKLRDLFSAKTLETAKNEAGSDASA
jgi:hypothetical protein